VLKATPETRVRAEEPRLADAAVDFPREEQAVVPEHVAQHERRTAKNVAAVTVGRVSDARARDVVRMELHAIQPIAELGRVRERHLGAVEKLRHRYR
jgi:hypothetical protein